MFGPAEAPVAKDLFLAEIRRIYAADLLIVKHEPETPRYNRATTLLGYIVRESEVLGRKSAVGHKDAVEVAMWAKNPRGKGCGLYTVTRMFQNGNSKPGFASATLFCCWDGNDKSHCFKTIGRAKEYARGEGYTKD